ncbi:MAG TPA: glycosyltransferase [Candidatus Limnocylindrales bacterium]
MTVPVNVLVYGALDAGSCDVFRAGMYADYLATLGVNLRPWTELNVEFAPGWENRPQEALDAGRFEIDRTDLDWADVVLFRRYYFTSAACLNCDTASRSETEIGLHEQSTGHRVRGPLDRLLRPLWARMESDPSFLGGRAVVYETDDDLLATPAWSGHSAIAGLEADLVQSMLGRADLVTVSTPPLERMAARFNKSVRLIRNAIEPAWYRDPAGLPDREGEPRLLFYGVPLRMRDYAVCRDGVDELARSNPKERRIWMGGDTEAIRDMVDEVAPYVRGASAFARALVEARPDIGLAPLADEPFNRGRSELHWLEYSMAGAPTIATRLAGGGPYDVIRDGVDGLLVRGKAEWREALRSLARSPALRAEISGRARERVLAEYRAADRAAEWAAAYRWAAENARSRAAGH